MQANQPAEARKQKTRAPAPPAAPPKSKKDQLLDLLRAKTGANVGELVTALGWQPHTVRAALTGLRKAGITVEKMPVRVGEPTRYRVSTKRGRAAQ